jgi:hypothetical protein
VGIFIFLFEKQEKSLKIIEHFTFAKEVER